MKPHYAPRLLALLLMAIATLPLHTLSAQTTRGEKSFGPKIGYVSRNTSAIGGLAFQYSLSRIVRISPEIGVIFRHRDLDGLTVDVNVHFPIGFAQGKMAFYPLVGANFTSWGQHNINPESHDDVTSHVNSFGLNAGAGLEFHCTESLKLSVEGRYTLMRHFPTAFATAGIAFVF